MSVSNLLKSSCDDGVTFTDLEESQPLWILNCPSELTVLVFINHMFRPNVFIGYNVWMILQEQSWVQMKRREISEFCSVFIVGMSTRTELHADHLTKLIEAICEKTNIVSNKWCANSAVRCISWSINIILFIMVYVTNKQNWLQLVATDRWHWNTFNFGNVVQIFHNKLFSVL